MLLYQEEVMQEQPENKSIESTVSPVSAHATGSGKSRRQFLTKATAGLVIASLPARSVWASGGGVAQSIVASGHGSDFAGGDPIELLSPGYWSNHELHQHKYNFYNIFGGRAFTKSGFPSLKTGLTFGDILVGDPKFKGCGNCNFHMVGIYLNAINHGKFGINYPIIGFGQPFATASDFAKYLYNKALLDPNGVGSELSSIIDNYHA
ncbi:hypothetical protein [Rheinheimera sp. 4Y26]|uniref:hypothetical protein n=1 Tax=Rheinheimera sp. 4Y26 TaxID=2977811 RepID=UPI0021B0FF26|nr:hypothetical protein [Rheinheimera sp. 4Y26]